MKTTKLTTEKSQKSREAKKARRILNRKWFKLNGVPTYKPLGLTIVGGTINVYADIAINQEELQIEQENLIQLKDKAILVLRQKDTKEAKYIAFDIEYSQILKAREQRMQLAYLEGQGMVASLFARDLEGIVDKSIKDPKEVIKRYKEEYLSHFSYSIISRDVLRILNTWYHGE